jgi:hypothetical protein
MLVAARAVLLPLDALGMEALVLGGEVIAILALAAGEDDLVAWHVPSKRREAEYGKRKARGHAASLEPLPLP